MILESTAKCSMDTASQGIRRNFRSNLQKRAARVSISMQIRAQVAYRVTGAHSLQRGPLFLSLYLENEAFNLIKNLAVRGLELRKPARCIYETV